MKLKLFALLTSILVVSNVSAQMASASLFGSMSQINPAVIGERPAGQMAFLAKKDDVTKTQTLTSGGAFQDGDKDVQEIDVTTLDFFYGGKGGNLTTEIKLNLVSGEKIETITASGSSQNDNGDLESKYAYFGIALGKYIGVSASYFNYTNQQSGSFTFGGSTTESNAKTDVTLMNLTGGLKGNLLLFDLGLFATIQKQENDTGVGGAGSESATGTGKTSNNYPIVGIAIGTSTGKFSHFEVGVERYLKAVNFGTDPNTGKDMELTPIRLAATAEFRISKLSLGYTGYYYKNGFVNPQTMLLNNLVYQSSPAEGRLEHNINFAWGGASKGFSLSGSLSMSKTETQEGNGIISDGQKYKTEVDAKSFSIALGYVF